MLAHQLLKLDCQRHQAAHARNAPFPGMQSTAYTLAVGRSQVKPELRAIPQFNNNLPRTAVIGRPLYFLADESFIGPVSQHGFQFAHQSSLKIGGGHGNLRAVANVVTIGSLAREGLLQQRSALAAREQSRQERLLFCVRSSGLVAAIVEQPFIHTLPYLLLHQGGLLARVHPSLVADRSFIKHVAQQRSQDILGKGPALVMSSLAAGPVLGGEPARVYHLERESERAGLIGDAKDLAHALGLA